VSSLVGDGVAVGGRVTSVGVTVEEGSATGVLTGVKVAEGASVSVGSRVLLGTIVTPDVGLYVTVGSSVAVSVAFAVCVAVSLGEEPQATKNTSNNNRRMGIYVFITSTFKMLIVATSCRCTQSSTSESRAPPTQK
jgi:hypothetical protein